MLVLTRGIGDRIVIADDIVLTVVRIHGQRVQIGFEAPRETAIRRAETLAEKQSKSTTEAAFTHPNQEWN